MAIGIMKEAGELKHSIPRDAAFLGVLSLDGSIKVVEGMLPTIIGAKKAGIKTLYLPLVSNFPLAEIVGSIVGMAEIMAQRPWVLRTE